MVAWRRQNGRSRGGRRWSALRRNLSVAIGAGLLAAPAPGAACRYHCPLIVGQKPTERWHQPVVSKNRGGAGGNIAAMQAAKAEPNGTTHPGSHTSAFAGNPSPPSSSGRLPDEFPRRDHRGNHAEPDRRRAQPAVRDPGRCDQGRQKPADDLRHRGHRHHAAFVGGEDLHPRRQGADRAHAVHRRRPRR